ncbi:MAG: glycosyltransferase family 39 protein [Bdellovibrionales bacterium]|nr:glycosyltransferase family 39 protein [Bdellovibrionales bacterium]
MINLQRATVLVFLAALLTLPWLGEREFYSRGEPREALAAVSMLETGSWVLGSGYGGVIPSKPPLTHWLMIGFSSLAGKVSEYSARLPSACAALLFLPYFFLFVKERTTREHAFLSAIILLTSIEWFRSSSTARVDMLLATLTCAAVLELYRYREAERSSTSWTIVLLLSAATLTKGPIALFLPAVIFAVGLRCDGRSLSEIFYRSVRVFAPAVIISSSWYIAAYWYAGEPFLHKFYYENIARLTSTMVDKPHRHSIAYLYLTLLSGLFPWSIVGLSVRLASIKWSSIGLGAIHRVWQRQSPFDRYSIITIAVFLIFFSIPSSKRSVYLLPIYPLCSCLLAGWILSYSAQAKQVLRVAIGAISAVLMSICVVSVILPKLDFVTKASSSAELLNLQLSFYSTVLSTLLSSSGVVEYCLAVCILGFGLWLILGNGRSSASTLLLVFGFWLYLILLTLNAKVLPAFANALSSKKFAKEIAPYAQSARRIYSFKREFYGISFYINRGIYTLSQKVRSEDLVLVETGKLSELEDRLSPNLCVQEIMRSTNAIEKPLEKVSLVRVQGCRR